jgi:hypothetical protein
VARTGAHRRAGPVTPNRRARAPRGSHARADATSRRLRLIGGRDAGRCQCARSAVRAR